MGRASAVGRQSIKERAGCPFTRLHNHPGLEFENSGDCGLGNTSGKAVSQGRSFVAFVQLHLSVSGRLFSRYAVPGGIRPGEPELQN